LNKNFARVTVYYCKCTCCSRMIWM